MKKWGARLSVAVLSTVLTATVPLSALADVNTAGEQITEAKEMGFAQAEEEEHGREAERKHSDKSEANTDLNLVEKEEPIEKEPAKEESTEKESTKEEPAEEGEPTEEGTTEEKPTKEEPTEEKPTKEEPTEEEPAEEKPTEEEPTEEKPTEEEPTEEKPTEEEPTEEKPTEEEPTEEKPTEEEPTEEKPTEEEPTEEDPTEVKPEELPATALPEKVAAQNKETKLIFTKETVELGVAETVSALDLLEIPKGYEEIDIEWLSSDNEIATVDEEGIVTAAAAGSCVITASLAEEEAEGELTVIVKETKPVYDQIDELTSVLKENSKPSGETMSEEELEQATAEAADIRDLEDEYKELEERAESGVRSRAADNYHSAIIIEADFLGTSYVRGTAIEIPFNLYCLGIYYGDQYFVEILDSSGRQVGRTSGTFPYALETIPLKVTWRTSSSTPTGTYFVRFWSTGRMSDTYDIICPFFVVKNNSIAAPAINKIVNTVQGVHVYWNRISGAKNYTVYRATSKTGTYKKIATTSALNYTDTSVTSGKTYYYKVKANSSSAQSAASAAKGIIFVGTPDLTLRVNRSTGIGLGWNKITGATGYAIYRKTTGSWVRIATISGNNTFTWTDTGVQTANGTVYHYTIRALAGSDKMTLSGCRNTGRTMVRLLTPTLSSATRVSATSLKAAWNRNTTATGYEVRLMVGNNVYRTYTYGNNATIAKTITGLPSGRTYKVQVRSYKKVSGVGSFYSAWSAAKTVAVK